VCGLLRKPLSSISVYVFNTPMQRITIHRTIIPVASRHTHTHTHTEITIFNAHQDAVKAIYKKKAFKKGSFVVI